MRRSRLSRRLEEQTKKNFLLSIAGIIIVVIFLGKFGLPILLSISSFISGSNNQDAGLKTNSFTYIAPPQLDPTFSATNSAEIFVTGTATKGEKIKLYLNGDLRKDIKVKDDNSFSFENITLKKGTNRIKAKAVSDKDSKKESDYSEEITVVFKDEKPNLTIDVPSDGQSFSKDENNITVSGKTDPGMRVTVNDFWAIVDESGKFSYNLHLSDGENTIKVVVSDDAGNKTEKELKITYSN